MTGARGIRVLIVDDDPRVRTALLRMLDELGDVRAAAVDTEQALRLSGLTTPHADVAVVDLPGSASRGDEVVRRLAPGVPVVAVSLSGSTRRAALRAGAAIFLEKDGDDDALVDAIRAAAAGKPGQNVRTEQGHASHRKEGQPRCPTN